MAAGYIIAIVVVSMLALALGGALTYVVVQRDNDDDPAAPAVVVPELPPRSLVGAKGRKALADIVAKADNAMRKKKKKKDVSLFGKHASEEEDFEAGRYLYSGVDLTPPSSIEPMLVGAVPASQSPTQNNFRSHVVVPENELHKRLWLHGAG